MANRNVVAAETMCGQCRGTGVNRFGNGNCIPCRGKGFLDSTDQMNEQLFKQMLTAKALVQRFDNQKRLAPELFKAVVASNPELPKQIEAARKVVEEYARTRAMRSTGASASY